jgi:hypothetical protein
LAVFASPDIHRDKLREAISHLNKKRVIDCRVAKIAPRNDVTGFFQQLVKKRPYSPMDKIHTKPTPAVKQAVEGSLRMALEKRPEISFAYVH